MTYYIIQTLLLLVVAYFLGAWCGCTLRSITSYRASMRAAAIGPSGQSVPAHAGSDRQTVTALRDAGEDRPRAATMPVESSERDHDGAKSEPPSAERPASGDDAEAAKKRQAIEAAATAAATAAAATITGEGAKRDAANAAISGRADDSARASASPGGETGVAEAGEGKPDNLRRIKNIDADLAASLNAHGVRRYVQIAEWKQEDVSAISSQFALSDRISLESWIEQAKILADGGVTVFAHNFDRGRIPGSIAASGRPSSVRMEPAEGQGAADNVAGEETRRAGTAADASRTGTVESDLTDIRGIDAELVGRLSALDVHSFHDIASWNADDVKRISAALGVTGRIERENWIEQASLLASGAKTKYASSRSG